MPKSVLGLFSPRYQPLFGKANMTLENTKEPYRRWA